MRFFAAAIARRSKEAIRRASMSTKPSNSASGSDRLTYPYRSAGPQRLLVSQLFDSLVTFLMVGPEGIHLDVETPTLTSGTAAVDGHKLAGLCERTSETVHLAGRVIAR
jgi:hypothetical protein